MVRIEIDGKTFEVDNGSTIIEVADKAGIPIPRFCYHKKLSVAANCRMCLVSIENSKKTVPACATPVADGMKVFTQSEETKVSQKAVMEFLLINHPLDCPICDQGGECELQDVSMGYGRDNSEYEEAKRVVVDDNLGTLIATEMTRCIHCTRCVRFGDEIAGVRELGATGRGENMQIGTYVQHSMTSEVSGNIIELCPVGALTSKPYRFTARPWELTQMDGIALHDCLGSNVHWHVRRNTMMRVVPKENEAINETWLSDRDRFSYLGLKSKSRAAHPMIKKDGSWQEVDWEEALAFTAAGIARVIKQHGAEQFAAFASPSSSLEEMYLLQKWMRELSVHNLDYRVRQTDFRGQEGRINTSNALAYADLENQESIVLIGCNIHREVPLAGTRVRKAFRQGAKVYAINPLDYDFHFKTDEKIVVSPLEMPQQLAKLVLSLADDVNLLPPELQRLLIGLTVDKKTKQIAAALKKSKAAIVTGALFENHPEYALLSSLIHTLSTLSGARMLHLTTGANAIGAEIAGMLPHRNAAGKEVNPPGLHAQAAIEKKLKGYFLMALEPGYDFANPFRARQSLLAADFVVLLSAFEDEAMHDYADVILPISPYFETSGTYVNVDRVWQTVKGACQPYEEARPAWKILRVLANMMHCPGFEYASTEEILAEVQLTNNLRVDAKYQPFYPECLPEQTYHLTRVGEWPLYRSDPIVRNAEALQKCASADLALIRIHPETAKRLKLGELATVSQGDIEITLPLKRDERVPPDVIWVANAMPETVDLGHSFGPINIK
jgi:NADH-quinone oxidoreductase subunit G